MRKTLVLLSALMLIGLMAVSQNIRVAGRVTNERGEPVPYATISQTGTSNATTADSSGAFSISVPQGASLAVTAAGYQGQTLRVTGTTLNFTLQTGQAQMQEVVVTALGIRRNRNQVPYAAQQIGGDEVSR